MNTDLKTENTLKNNCATSDSLQAYLRLKGSNHNYYKCYSSLERIIDIRDSQNLYLSNGEDWNDIIDRESFNEISNSHMNYGKCFSFSRDESVAMWMLYGGIDKLSGMIDFTKKSMQSILNLSSIELGYFDNKEYQTVLQLKKSQFKIYITDVLYYTKNGSGYYISRSDESYPCLSQNIFNELSGCKKTYPWKYENECRLIVSVDKKLLNENCKIVKIDLKNIDMGKSFQRIYHGPNYPLENTYNSLQSELKNTIDWSLCDGKKCVNNVKENKGDNS